MNDGLFYGVGGLVLGVIGGFLMFNTGIDEVEDRLNATLSGAGGAAIEATEEQSAALGGRLTAIEEALAAGAAAQSETQAALTAAAEERAALSGSVAGMGETVTAAVDGLKGEAAAQQETLMARIDALSGEVQSVGAAAAAAAAQVVAAAPAEAGDAAAAAAPAAEAAPEIEGLKVGQTEVFEDGALRIFLSGLNEEANTARIAVNGTQLFELSIYGGAVQPDPEGPCTITLAGIEAGHAQFETDCGN